MRHDPQLDDPYLETDLGKCPECDGANCMTEGTFSFSFDYEWTDPGNGLITLSVEGYIRDDEVFEMSVFYGDGSKMDPVPKDLDDDLVEYIHEHD